MRAFDSRCMSMAFSSHNFFGHELTPSIEYVGKRRIDDATPYEQRDALEYVYICDGSGDMEVNGVRSSVGKGSCLVLTGYQLCRFLPEKGNPLKVDYCRLKNGAVYAFWSCPYYQQPDFRISVEKTSQIQRFASSQTDLIEKLWENMCRCQLSDNEFAKEEQLYLFMEYLGYFHRLCYRENGESLAQDKTARIK